MVEISASAGIAQVKVDVPMPSPEQVRGWWQRRRRPNGSVHLRLLHADFTIDRADEGTAVFFMEVINNWRRNVTIDRLLIQHWSWASHSLPDVTPTVNGTRSVISRRSLGNLSMTITLDRKMVRIIREAAVKAPNLFSTPRIDLYMWGQLFVLESPGGIMYSFTQPFPGVFITVPPQASS